MMKISWQKWSLLFFSRKYKETQLFVCFSQLTIPSFSLLYVEDVVHLGVDGEQDEEHGQHWKIQQFLHAYPETQDIFFTVALSMLFLDWFDCSASS